MLFFLGAIYTVIVIGSWRIVSILEKILDELKKLNKKK